jgi:hypothetical protein
MSEKPKQSEVEKGSEQPLDSEKLEKAVGGFVPVDGKTTPTPFGPIDG